MSQFTTGPSKPHIPLSPARAVNMLLVTASIAVLTACGTKFSNSPPAVYTPENIPSSVPERPEPAPTAPTAVSPEIRPTSIPDETTPRSLPAAITLRDQAVAAAADGNHTRAIGLLERAIRISPNDPETFTALAQSHLAQSRPQQALELTRRALTLNPTIEQQLTLEALEQRCLALL